MTRGAIANGYLNGPVLLACGAFITPRLKTVRCQKCYGRRVCACESAGIMPCTAGEHHAPGSKHIHTGRMNRGFVDLGHNRRGFGSAK